MQVKIFVAYSHLDKKYLGPDSLLGFLRGLELDNVAQFWHDERITTGDLWDLEIQAKIDESHIALLLISECFLTSPYVQKKEIPAFLKKKARRGDGHVSDNTVGLRLESPRMVAGNLVLAKRWKEHREPLL